MNYWLSFVIKMESLWTGLNFLLETIKPDETYKVIAFRCWTPGSSRVQQSMKRRNTTAEHGHPATAEQVPRLQCRRGSQTIPSGVPSLRRWTWECEMVRAARVLSTEEERRDQRERESSEDPSRSPLHLQHRYSHVLHNGI